MCEHVRPIEKAGVRRSLNNHDCTAEVRLSSIDACTGELVSPANSATSNRDCGVLSDSDTIRIQVVLSPLWRRSAARVA